jgi:hypothetical protein
MDFMLHTQKDGTGFSLDYKTQCDASFLFYRFHVAYKMVSGFL